MPRGRMLNKKISFNEDLPKLSIHATLLFTWCIPHLDIGGKIHADVNFLKGNVVPYLRYFTRKRIELCLEELEYAGLVNLYGNEHKYMQFKGFTDNQNLNPDRESPSEIPDPTPAQLRRNSG